MKRVFDIIVSGTLLLILSPLIVFIWLMVRLKLGDPSIFKQVRPGFHGKPFYIQKFRTMTDDKDEYGNLLPDEKRLHQFGKLLRKLSLDELPQLFNVLKGEMSLVGPRPLLMEYLPLYTAEQARRHEVKPGITGWAQINGRNALTWEEKLKLDIWYVDNCSFLLDLKILWLTVEKVLKSEDVSQKGHATMPKFTGTTD